MRPRAGFTASNSATEWKFFEGLFDYRRPVHEGGTGPESAVQRHWRRCGGPSRCICGLVSTCLEPACPCGALNPRRKPHLARRAPLTGSARVPGSRPCALRRIRAPAFERCAGACDAPSSSLLPLCASEMPMRESNDMGRTLLTGSGRPATSPLPGLGGTESCVAFALAGGGLVRKGATRGPAAARRARGAAARGGVRCCPGLCPVVRKRSRLGMLA